MIISLFAGGCHDRQETNRYAVAVLPTPAWNTSSFPALFGGADGKTLRLDRCEQMRELEFVALPGSLFTIEETIANGPNLIFRVTSREYPYPTATGYFIDSRFVKTLKTAPPERLRELPPRRKVIANLLAAKGSIYVWGGNCRRGIPQLLDFFPPAAAVSPRMKMRWTLQGVDCSGLLFEATNGFTPRNVSGLFGYGQPVAIQGLTSTQIMARVEPLDLIVRQRHVQIILDRQWVIESRLGCRSRNGGVVVRPLREVLTELMGSRTPLNDPVAIRDRGEKGFVIRRWYKGEIRTSSGCGGAAPPQPTASGPG